MTVDLERLLKLRVVVARVGEMDLAQWWNTKGQLGKYGSMAVSRGLPRTHWFAQARSVFAVAAHRCDELFNPPGSVTLWRLTGEIEQQFDARWEHCLDNAGEWDAFFERVAALSSGELKPALEELGLVGLATPTAVSDLRFLSGARAVQLPGEFFDSAANLDLLAAAFTLGRQGNLIVPYQRLAE